MKWIISLLIMTALLASCESPLQAPAKESNDEQSSEDELDGNKQDSQGSSVDENKSNDTTSTQLLDQPKTVVDQLESPWDIVKNGEEFYITERAGTIVHFDGESAERQSLQLEREVASGQGEEGLLGMVLDPDDEEKAYIYHTYQTADGLFNRIVAIELDDRKWKETGVLVDEIPGGRIHDGGRLAIGPNGYLFATTGDAGNDQLSQDTDSLAGKILRMNLDGSIPDDQPFKGSLVYSYGHRNPQGLTWNENGELYSSEHGSSAYDEINHIEPGNNYGWPVIRGDETEKNMKAPTIHSGEETWAPSGSAFDDSGNLLVTGLAGQSLYRFDVESGNEEVLLENHGRLRDILVANGEIYVLTNNTDGRGNPDESDDLLLKIAE
ncbi:MULTISPECIES: sorbosone dehydrogenase family protein [Allobacillus]|uniref:PQQ-dependent sugar dehydrogenase n=1 Tax=Allobacillus salarius TaxID=1955272 RepID=A0A556PP98_9BACI|nr:PQQ-dependent sugar dehydrogenase [Allobacillus salarius]TSJ66221.1 PQQ-dependent sugar dehydrogenase [Allobacillus salarius]